MITPRRLLANVLFRVPARPSTRRHVFVIGVPRSGTTLLKTLLAAHSQIGYSDNESTGIFGFRDIFAYELGEIPPEGVRALLAESADLVEFYDAVVDRLLIRTGGTVFVDKLTIRRYRLHYVQRVFPRSVFVHIIRDGRDGFCSARHHPNVPQASSLEGFARYWSRTVELPGRILDRARLLEIRYEDLTESPEESLRGVMEFIGLPFDLRQIDVGVYSATTTMKKRTVHSNLARPVGTASHARWARELTPDQIETFERLAGPALRGHGYRR